MLDAERARRLHQSGDLQAAARHYLLALEKASDDAVLRHDYAILLLNMGDAAKAATELERIPASATCYPQAILALAHCHRASGNISAGLASASAAVAQHRQHPLPWLLLGSLQVMAGNPVQAEEPLRQALALAPDFAEAWHYLGESLQALGRYAEAAHAYQQAARAQPVEVFNIGLCAELAGELQHAHQCYQQMRQLAPARLDNLIRLAHIRAQLCLLAAQESLVATINQQLANSAPLQALELVEPFPLTYLALPEAFKKKALAAHATRFASKASKLPALPPRPARSQRLRLGYISPDLGNHAVGSLLQHHFAAHDRGQFEVRVYSLRRFDDPIAQRITHTVEHFVDVSDKSDYAIATQIRHDGIDVLIDLGGYTHGARPTALALRPAAVQLGWLGFIHAQQAPWLDGLILDRWCAPPDQDWPYTDRVLRMESPLFPGWQPPPVKTDRARLGLPEDVPIFASFNNSYKLDRPLLQAWQQILAAVPQARLLVHLRDEASRAGFAEAWQSIGGDIHAILPAPSLSFEEQLCRAASCDLLLDAFRYQAGATAIFSMAAGLPMLSLAGTTPLSCMGAGINAYLGMEQLLAQSPDDYVAKAIALANSPQRLRHTRAQLAERIQTHALLEPRRAAAEIERIALECWQSHLPEG